MADSSSNHSLEKAEYITSETGSQLKNPPEKQEKPNKIGPDSVDTTKIDNDAVLPLLEPPGDFEVWAYYWAFPSRPRLLGRTSSGVTPWWRLTEPPKNPFYGPTSNLESATTCGPVGPHAIHACWRVSTLSRVRAALIGLPWTSIDVMRIGRAALQEHQRPVIVWVGVSPSAMAEIAAPWDLVASKLRAVRAALDADNLADVECEMRESEIIQTVDSNQRLLPPPNTRDRFLKPQMELDAVRIVSTAVGRTITPGHCETNTGTLGLYLAPETESSESGDHNGTVWALTCHHVAFPKHGGRTEPPATILLSARLLRSRLNSYVNPLIFISENNLADAKHPSRQTPEEACYYKNSQRNLKSSLELRDVLLNFRASDDARTLGHVHHSPSIGIKDVGAENAYMRDWALITLDRQKFPVGYDFENVVDLAEFLGRNLCGLINKHIRRFTAAPLPEYEFPRGKLLRLQGIVPVASLLGQATTPVALERDADRQFVMKCGSTTSLTAGIVLDIESVLRHSRDVVEEETFELAVVHLSNPQEHDPSMPYSFSRPGDSGAVVFDLRGGIVGLLMSGSGNSSSIDCTYVTPFAKLQSDIEQTIGRRVRVL
ncbi:hypothetical protein SEPCBS57363_003661 [Sporothrix epigloea]|uniref:Uncharacterized protein n=1 Tax=Sporothrix epigloea TaxID=1892477 RepID=A0ABP0DMN9_9PEZI